MTNKTTTPEATTAAAAPVDAIVMRLAPDEVAIIKKLRAEKEAARLARDLQKTTLLLISGWMAWHDETGSGLTWTTFMDEFDCDQYIPMELQKYRKQIYEMVDRTICSVYADSCEAVGA